MHALTCFLAGLLLSGFAAAAPNNLRVVIIDNIYPPAAGFQSDAERRSSTALYGLIDLDLDRETKPYYHGDLVRIIATHPRLSFFQYPIRPGPHPMAEILSNLRKLRARHSRHPVDTLILSWESSTLFSAFETPLIRAHSAHYKAIDRDWGKQDGVWRDTYQIILQLEALAHQGVAVYTIAGNGGRGMVNVFSFAEGVTTVGAREPELAHFVSDNAFVDLAAQAAYFITRIDAPDGTPLGYDVDGDSCPDIPLSRLTNYGRGGEKPPKHYWRPIKGSSFAAPMALRQALLKGRPFTRCSNTLRF